MVKIGPNKHHHVSIDTKRSNIKLYKQLIILFVEFNVTSSCLLFERKITVVKKYISSGIRPYLNIYVVVRTMWPVACMLWVCNAINLSC